MLCSAVNFSSVSMFISVPSLVYTTKYQVKRGLGQIVYNTKLNIYKYYYWSKLEGPDGPWAVGPSRICGRLGSAFRDKLKGESSCEFTAYLRYESMAELKAEIRRGEEAAERVRSEVRNK